MKQIKLLFLMLIVVLVSINLSSCSNDEPSYNEVEHDAEVNGYGYRILSLDKLTVEFTALTSPSNYSGSVTIPSTVNINGRDFSVIKIASAAFDKSSVSSVTIPNSITDIGTYAFRGCKKLKNINIPSSVETINVATFYQSGLESITIPASVATIYLGSFSECESLKSVTIEDSTAPLYTNEVSSNNDYYCIGAFSGSNVESVYVGRDAISTSYATYYTGTFGFDTGSLKSITFGSEITNANPALNNADLSNVNTITSKAIVPPSFYDGYFSNNVYMTANVYVPASALQDYKDNYRWGKFWNIEAIK